MTSKYKHGLMIADIQLVHIVLVRTRVISTVVTVTSRMMIAAAPPNGGKGGIALVVVPLFFTFPGSGKGVICGSKPPNGGEIGITSWASQHKPKVRKTTT